MQSRLPNSGDAARKAPQPPWWGGAAKSFLIRILGTAVRFSVRLDAAGLEHARNAPGLVVVFNHKSDLDGPIIVPALYWHFRGRGPIGRTAFVGGEHIFQPGFLAGYVMPRPAWLRPLLFHVSPAAVMRAIRCYPVPMAKRRFLAAHLTDLLKAAGDLPLGDVLSRSPDTVFPGVAAGATVRYVLRGAYAIELFTLHDLNLFRPEIAEALIEYQRTTIRDAIDGFAAVLDEGDALTVAPEGALTPDGRIGRIKSGLQQIVQRTTRDLALLPMGVTYDFMSTGRPAAYLRIGSPVTGAKEWPAQEWPARVRRMLAQQTTVTLSQLAAQYVLEQARENVFSLGAASMKAELARRASAFAAEGLHVASSLLQPAEFDQCWTRFLAYCHRHALATESNGTLTVYAPESSRVRHAPHVRVSPWVYAANELTELLEARNGR